MTMVLEMQWNDCEHPDCSDSACANLEEQVRMVTKQLGRRGCVGSTLESLTVMTTETVLGHKFTPQ